MKYQVIIQTDFRNRPKEHELSAAVLIADYFEADVFFLRPSCQKTPDLCIRDVKWELKSPLGDGKNTIKNNLHTARKQSINVIIDLRRMKMHQTKAISNIKHYFKDHRSKIRHLIIITKTEEVLELF